MTTPAAVTSVVDRMSLVPAKSDVALVLRHAERQEIPLGTFGEEVPLTSAGITSAEELGAMLSEKRPEASILASTVPRCVETGEAILRGGCWGGEVAPDWRLGAPGPFVVEPEVSGPLFLEIGISEIVRRQLSDDVPPPGMRTTTEGIGLLLALTSNDLGWRGRLNVYVTHDSILAVLAAHLFRLTVDAIGWPDYLDGLLMWRSNERLHFTWRGLEQCSQPVGR